MSGLSDEQREALTRALAQNGVGDPGCDLHSWRCSHPDRYGPCDCVGELVSDLGGIVQKILADALREQREGIAAAIESERRAHLCFSPAGLEYTKGWPECARIARNYGTKEAE